MTKGIRMLIASLFLGTALLAGAQDAVRVKVPFDFHAAGKTFPAGTYTVAGVLDRSPGVLNIRSAQNGDSVTLLAGFASSSQTGAGLSFRHYGDSYYLSGITTLSGTFSLPRTRAERMAASKDSGGEVTVGSK